MQIRRTSSYISLSESCIGPQNTGHLLNRGVGSTYHLHPYPKIERYKISYHFHSVVYSYPSSIYFFF